METCETCAYYKDGECYRYPPTVNIEADEGCRPSYYYDRPVVNPNEYCGEYKKVIKK